MSLVFFRIKSTCWFTEFYSTHSWFSTFHFSIYFPMKRIIIRYKIVLHYNFNQTLGIETYTKTFNNSTELKHQCSRRRLKKTWMKTRSVICEVHLHCKYSGYGQPRETSTDWMWIGSIKKHKLELTLHGLSY